MGLLAKLSRLARRGRKVERSSKQIVNHSSLRRCFFETIEPRRMLDADPLLASPDEIRRMTPLETWIGGYRYYKAKEGAAVGR